MSKVSYVRARYQILGGHVHVRVFSGENPKGTFGKNGDLTFSVEEWPSIVTGLLRANWELIDETPTVDSTVDWAKAEVHLREYRQQYVDIGSSGLLGLRAVIEPLMVRFERGERTQGLYDAILSIR